MSQPSTSSKEDSTLLAKLDAIVPTPLAQFDAFPKLPSTYKARSESRGFMTLFVALIALLLMLNDIGEYIWGWPQYSFSVDQDTSSLLNVNLDMTVNMQCRYLSIDLRDALGDRLFLSGSLRRDGTTFDTSQATAFKEHAAVLSARQVVAQSKTSRGLFDTILRRRTEDGFKPTYNHQANGDACRIWGSLKVKRVTANLHVTTLGHGYASYEHVDHTMMNLSHVITEFSFGPHFPDITQPLDYTFETTPEPFVAYQYFLHVVPTTYIAPRSKPVHTNQYSVTHYTRVLDHDSGTPGIFFKFDLDPLSITLHQKTTSFIQLAIRCVGVLGGIFVCMGYAIRITTRAVEVVSGADQTPGIVAAEASGVKVGLRAKWGGGHLRSRGSRTVSGGAVAAAMSGSSPYSSFANTPMSSAGVFAHQQQHQQVLYTLGSAAAGYPYTPGSSHLATPPPPPSSGFPGTPHHQHHHSGSPLPPPSTPGYAHHLPPSPNPPPPPSATQHGYVQHGMNGGATDGYGNGTGNGNGNGNGSGSEDGGFGPPLKKVVGPKKDD
ncbi:hypothetical protein AMATHDRAFT_71676 [Amanita thiersii Skay4041]|uniref:DUF1692-domain-containing protein n=1 Tax=Amanita thiersii Skay4041 TaxID=703135 RepID=A0A2A9N6R1_9AGAR|nr:hypothetical protein AMATHDRAFT_71676 [Amanita thiersii Skay4041]